MAAGAWTFYNKAKKNIGNGTIKLGVDTFKMQLHTSASNAATATIDLASSISNEVSNANGYTTGGKLMTSVTWTTGASAGQYRFSMANIIWTASSGNISNIKFAVIKNSAGRAMCYSQLTTAQFPLTQNNTLTIAPSATGIFNLA